MRIPKEKRERSLGIRLQVKGVRCASPKCAMVRKPYAPGMHGPKKGSMKALSDFGRQLKEKQKCKVVYGIDERALRQIFERAVKKTGSTSVNVIEILESRLDNIVFRLGLASSRTVARQLVVHGHIMVNGKRVRAPGYLVQKNDIVSIREESKAKNNFKTLKDDLQKFETPSWLQLDLTKLEGRVVGVPEDQTSPFEVNLLVESFSK